MKNPATIVLLGAIIVVLIPAVLIFLNRKEKGDFGTETKTEREINFGEVFKIKNGEKVRLGTLFINHSGMSYPPESFEGDREEYTYAQLIALENEDAFRFSVAPKHTEQRYHDYLIKFIKREGEVVTLLIESSPMSVKVSEEEAVKKALEEAEKNNIQRPEARIRTLKENVWEIEVGGGPDVFFIVKINSGSGEILEAFRQPRS